MIGPQWLWQSSGGGWWLWWQLIEDLGGTWESVSDVQPVLSERGLVIESLNQDSLALATCWGYSHVTSTSLTVLHYVILLQIFLHAPMNAASFSAIFHSAVWIQRKKKFLCWGLLDEEERRVTGWGSQKTRFSPPQQSWNHQGGWIFEPWMSFNSL